MELEQRLEDVEEEHIKEKEILEQNLVHQRETLTVDADGLREQIETELTQEIQTQLEVIMSFFLDY